MAPTRHTEAIGHRGTIAPWTTLFDASERMSARRANVAHESCARPLILPQNSKPITPMSRNEALYARAITTIPGGVNSPVRAFGSVGGTPRFISRAKGPYMWDANGQRYIDYIGSWGPMIAGHAHPDVISAIERAARDGCSYGAPTEAEVEMAETLCRLIPSIEQVRMVSSGTEATMSALRLARGFTGRDQIVKFEGCYHGHADSLLVKSGSGMLTFGHPSSAGVPADVVRHTTVLEYNNVESLEACFKHEGERIAAVIVEPVAGNMNLVPGNPNFLATLRKLCTQYGSILIFDEVMSGFRVALGGAQARYNITPDLTCLGKIIGGGMPAAAFGGRRDIMAKLAPLGAVYQAGTLSGNPLAVAAGMATLALVQADGFYPQLEARTARLVEGLCGAADAANVPFSAHHIGGMFGLYFMRQAPASFAQVQGADLAAFNAFFHHMLDLGIYFAPSAYEAGFVSSAHDEAVIDATIDAAHAAFAALAH